MFFREYLRLMLRRPLLSLLVGAAVFAAGLGLSLTGKQTYLATSSSLFAFTSGNSATDLNQAATYLQREMTSYVRVATSPRVLQPVIDRLGLTETPTDLAESIEVSNPSVTVILDIAVTREDPEEAAAIANAVTETLSEVATEMAPTQQEGEAVRQTLTVTPLTVAQPPEDPENLPLPVSAALGLVLGALASFAVALLASGLDTRVRTVEDLQRMRGARVLAALPRIQPGNPDQQRALAERLERTTGLLIGARRDDGGSLVLVTTPDTDADLPHVTAALARAAALVGGRAAVCDTAELSAMRVADLAHRAPAGDATVAVDVIDTEGRVTSLTRPADLGALADEFDIVVLQTPAFTASADAQLLAEAADVALVVVTMGANQERVMAVQAGLRALDDHDVVLLANRVRSHDL